MIFKLIGNLIIITVVFQVIPGSWTNALNERFNNPELILGQILWQGVENANDIGAAITDEATPEKDSESLGVRISALSGVVVDKRSGKILFEKNSDEKRPIASITKLMTALVFLDSDQEMDDYYRVSTCGEFKNENIRKRDLFYSMLVASDNCAARFVALSTGKSMDEFVLAMNQRAAELGLRNTEFFEPTGLNQNNQSSALEIVKILREAINHSEIRDATTFFYYEFRSKEGNYHYLKNTDNLLGSFIDKAPYDIIGGKTGSLDAAGYCLALAVEHNGNEIIVVTLDSKDHYSRFHDVKSLVHWAFSNYKWP